MQPAHLRPRILVYTSMNVQTPVDNKEQIQQTYPNQCH